VKTSFEVSQIGSLIESLHNMVNGLGKKKRKEKKNKKILLEKATSRLPLNRLCIQEKNQQKEGYLMVMVEEYMKNNLDKRSKQGHQSYIEVWLQKIEKMEHHSLLQLCLILSKRNHLVSEIQVYVKAYISSLHIILSVILM